MAIEAPAEPARKPAVVAHKPAPAPVRVVAVRPGTYPHRGDIYPVYRKAGDVFELNDPEHFADHDLGGWMRLVKSDSDAVLADEAPSLVPQTTGRRKVVNLPH